MNTVRLRRHREGAGAAFQEIARLYNFNFIAFIRTFQRWYFGTPYEYVEQFVPTAGTIIDLGCGWGVFSNLLALRCPERYVIGIDLDRNKIKWAQKTVGNRNNVVFDVQDLESVRLTAVDAIIVYDVMHHLERSVQLNILMESYNKLCIGGRLILKENDIAPRWKLFVLRFIEMIASGFNITLGKKITFRSGGEWRNLLTQCKFDIIHEEHMKTLHGFYVPHSLFVCEKKPEAAV